MLTDSNVTYCLIIYYLLFMMSMVVFGPILVNYPYLTIGVILFTMKFSGSPNTLMVNV